MAISDIPTLGVGYLVHNSQRYLDYIDAVGADAVDTYEILFGHFASDPTEARRFIEFGKPLALHSTVLSIAGNPSRCSRAVAKLAEVAAVSGAVYIGEHLCYTGGSNTAATLLMPPLLTEEQVELICSNLRNALPLLPAPISFENIPFHYSIGHKRLEDVFNQILSQHDVGAIVSTESLRQTNDDYCPIDSHRFIAALPKDRVVQIHMTLGNYDEQREQPHLWKRQEWLFQLVEWMADIGIRPKAVYFELETLTASLPEPQYVRERMKWARQLFFN